jgi:hypothetical protein
MDIVMQARPESVLDVGIGFGKFGFLCREYLELWDGRNAYDHWKRRIDGIEVFETYVTPLQRMIYDHIYVGDALDVLPTLDWAYDLVAIIDVIEHLEQADGARVLKECARVGRSLLISSPKTVRTQGPVFGNEHEQHRFQWGRERLLGLDLRPAGCPAQWTVVEHPSKLIVFVTANSVHAPE